MCHIYYAFVFLYGAYNILVLYANILVSFKRTKSFGLKFKVQYKRRENMYINKHYKIRNFILPNKYLLNISINYIAKPLEIIIIK